jgi:hypothetical protein
MSEAGHGATKTELDDEVEVFGLEQTKTQSRKTAREAGRSASGASLPRLSKQSIEGKAEFGDKAGQLAEVAAFRALAHAAQSIAEELGEQAKQRGVRVVSSGELWKSDFAYQRVDAGLKRYNTALGELISTLDGTYAGADGAPTPDRGLASLGFTPAALSLPAAAVGAAADLMSMFRSDYRFAAREVANDHAALLSMLVAKLNVAGIPVALEDSMRVGSHVLGRLDEVQSLRDSLEALRIHCQLVQMAVLQQEIDELDGAIGSLEAPEAGGETATELSEKTERRRGLRERILGIETAARQASEAITSCDEFIAAVTAVPPKGYPIIVLAARQGELLEDATKSALLLYPRTVSIGGETITRRRIFGTSIRFYGTAVVSYLLLDLSSGEVKGGTAASACEIKYSTLFNRVGRAAVRSLD